MECPGASKSARMLNLNSSASRENQPITKHQKTPPNSQRDGVLAELLADSASTSKTCSTLPQFRRYKR